MSNDFWSMVFIPAASRNFPCSCKHCSIRSDLGQSFHNTECERLSRSASHLDRVSEILKACPKTVKLLVGPDKIKIVVHEALLGYWSDFFHGAFYGGFSEAERGEIILAEESVTAIQDYVCWVYTGTINSTLRAEELWVLGDRLISHEFTNEVMHLIFSIHRLWLLEASSIAYTYNNTTEKAKLRLYELDLALKQGPLREDPFEERAEDDKQSETRMKYRKDWKSLLDLGGPFVLDVVCKGSLFNRVDLAKLPYYWKSQHEFLEKVTTRPVQEFIQERTRQIQPDQSKHTSWQMQ